MEHFSFAFGASCEAICIYRHQKTNKKKEITNSFVRAAETRRFVLLIPISLHFSVLWSEMSCYRFPKYLLQPKALFFHSKLKYKCKEMHNAAIRHVFVSIAGLSSHVPWEAMQGSERAAKKESTNKNNALKTVHSDALSMSSVFIVCTFTDSNNLDIRFDARHCNGF